MSPSDRNLISWYVDGGFGIKGPVAARPDDVLTFGVAYQKISPDAAAADRDAGLAVIRSNEIVFELSYQAQLAPWWVLQPDIQYIVHPGGNVPDPNNPLVAGEERDRHVGLRSTIKFRASFRAYERHTICRSIRSNRASRLIFSLPDAVAHGAKARE